MEEGRKGESLKERIKGEEFIHPFIHFFFHPTDTYLRLNVDIMMSQNR